MAIEYKVCGVPVDRMTYEKYMAKTFNTADGERSMHSIELWANSEEIKRELPNEWAEVKAIYDSVRAELNQMNRGKPNSGRALRGYLEELQDTYKATFEERTGIENRYSDAVTAANVAGAKYGDQYHTEAIRDAEKARREELAALGAKYSRGVADIRGKMNKRLDEIFLAMPDKLDSATMSLLNSGVCTIDELMHLAEANTGNPTMQRVIAAHADKLATETEKRFGTHSEQAQKASAAARGVKGSIRKSADFLDAFDGLAEWGRNVCGDYNLAQRFNKRWDEQFSKHCEAVDSMDVYAS